MPLSDRFDLPHGTVVLWKIDETEAELRMLCTPGECAHAAERFSSEGPRREWLAWHAALRKIVPDKIRIAMFIVVIAGFVTCVDLLLQAFFESIAASLGVFIPLIVVNCIILGRAESFSYKNGVGASFFDGIFQGLGYTAVLLAMCFIRELLGAGTLAGFRIIPEQFPIGILTLPVGGFLVLGFLIAAMQWALSKSKEGK